jgi:hypothetical protein
VAGVCAVEQICSQLVRCPQCVTNLLTTSLFAVWNTTSLFTVCCVHNFCSLSTVRCALFTRSLFKTYSLFAVWNEAVQNYTRCVLCVRQLFPRTIDTRARPRLARMCIPTYSRLGCPELLPTMMLSCTPETVECVESAPDLPYDSLVVRTKSTLLAEPAIQQHPEAALNHKRSIAAITGVRQQQPVVCSTRLPTNATQYEPPIVGDVADDSLPVTSSERPVATPFRNDNAIPLKCEHPTVRVAPK